KKVQQANGAVMFGDSKAFAIGRKGKRTDPTRPLRGRAQPLPRRGIPEENGALSAAERQCLAVWSEREGVYPMERIRSAYNEMFTPRRQVPQPDLVVAATGRQELAVRRERDAVEDPLLAVQLKQFLAGRRQPHPARLWVATAESPYHASIR